MDAKQELTTVFKAWDAALAANDIPAMKQYMHPDWVIVGSDGITKLDAFIGSVASGDLVHTRMDSDEMHVQVYADTAVVTSKGTSAGTYKGQAFSFYEWSGSVFIKHNGAWVCVHTMLTPVAAAQ